ncbi:MAG: threonine synthase [Ardenticatenaceae bacterium]
MMYLNHLECSRCSQLYAPDERINLCTCGSPLLARYDLNRLSATLDPTVFADRPPTMWRYFELLPVRERENVVSLGEGGTPMLRAAGLGEQLDLHQLWIKDESLNPTGTFKARGASAGISRARELGINTLAIPTAGNAGGAWSAYAARAGIEIHVAMPKDAPSSNQIECRLFGAHLTLVDGLISDAGRWIASAAAEHGWFDVATLKEPYRIEGKKTMGLEIAEFFGWQMPDVVIYPAGGGVGIIGIWKAFSELTSLGWVAGPLPRMVIVQATGCAPLVRAFEQGRSESDAWAEARTIASGLRVPKALGDFLVLHALRDTAGTAIAISDTAIRSAMMLAARSGGIAMSPEGAATVAAAQQLRETGWLSSDESVVLINTGTLFKYLEAASELIAGE